MLAGRGLVPCAIAAAALGLASTVGAACVTNRCGLENAEVVEALRAELQATCDCDGSTRHAGYKRCVKDALRAARRDGHISGHCARDVKRCESRSICGRPGAVVCCAAERSDTRGTIKDGAEACRRGVACTERPSAFDACAPQEQCCLSSVQRGPPEEVLPDSPLASVTAMEVLANTSSGCAGLDGSLVALNWFSVADPEAHQRYLSRADDVLRDFGHSPLLEGKNVETLEAPPGVPAGGGSYVHEEFVLARYASARSFLDMIASLEFQEILPDQQAGARQSDYVWGLERCLVGCPDAAVALPERGILFVAHIFRYDGTDLDRAIRALSRRRRAPEIAYAGELVAELRMHIGDFSLNPQIPPWGRGAVVYRVPSRDRALEWLSDPAFTAFRRDTGEDVIVLLRAGL